MRRSKADAEQTRIAILDAAEKLFCAQGVTTPSLDSIAAAAGVTRGAVYWHFKDKSDLMVALRERYCLPQEDLIASAAANGHPDPLQLLENSGNEVLRLFATQPGRQRLFLFMSSQFPGTEEAARLREADEDVHRHISSLLRQAQAEGALSERLTPDEAALLMVMTMKGLLNEWLRSDKAFSLTELGGKLLHEQLRAFKTRPED